MGIEERFKIEFMVGSEDGRRSMFPVRASDFFEYNEYDESEWDCHLPWRFATLREFVPKSYANLTSIKVDIEDFAIGNCRRLLVQFLDYGTLTFSWDDVRIAPLAFETILDIRSNDGSVLIARVDVSDSGTNLTYSSVELSDDIA